MGGRGGRVGAFVDKSIGVEGGGCCKGGRLVSWWGSLGRGWVVVVWQLVSAGLGDGGVRGGVKVRTRVGRVAIVDGRA